MHGRLSAEEKDTVMKNFSENKIQVLVSTTVVEVGVNVPNATRDSVVPMNVVPVNHEGRLAKNVINCAGRFPRRPSSSS